MTSRKITLLLSSLLLFLAPSSYAKEELISNLKCGHIDYDVPNLLHNLPKKKNTHLHILAIGSSSTAGTGAGGKENAYIQKTSFYLNQKSSHNNPWPMVRLTARGIGGERAAGAVQRLEEAIMETKPDLLIWQVGTNDALGKIPMEDLRKTIETGLTIIEDNNLPVILIDPQFFPKIYKNQLYTNTVNLLSAMASTQNLPLVKRFERMKKAFSNEKMMQALLAKDKFHMSSLGHDCLARDLTSVIKKALRKERALSNKAAFNQFQGENGS